MQDGWEAASPEGAGLDPRVLGYLAPDLEKTGTNIHALLVARHGKIVFEQYFEGEDEHWGQPLGRVRFGPDLRHDLRSVTKSLTGLVFGVALERGWIASVDEPVFRSFPELADLRTPAKGRILLRHLLTMSAGLAWDEERPYTDPENSEIRMTMAADPYRFVLEQKLVDPPGEKWRYSGGTTALLAKVLERASGLKLDALMRETLFAPLGIEDVHWVNYPNGDPVAASGLQLRPRDLLKVGQLVLDGGRWRGRQVVPADWIREATTHQIDGPDGLSYGYQWWLGRMRVWLRPVSWAAGFGNGGQRLYVVPEKGFAVVIAAGLYNRPDGRLLPGEIFVQYVLRAARDP